MKIALVGAHRATKLDAPYDDPDWLIWSCSPRNESELPRFDAWFELHGRDVFETFGPIYNKWLRTLPHVFMQEHYGDIPGSRPYPLDSVRKEFGPYFFTGTPAYMLALAVQQAPPGIGLWGFGACPEYSHQRSSIFYFVRRAQERGIMVTGSAGVLDPPPLYAFG